jgi:uncharacterized protein YceH (UPF0502 family)
MEMKFTPEELRVLGSLIEKESTTPEYYPLSVNALVQACNQKTNREPVMTLDEPTVGRALERLREAGMVHRSAEGGRVARYAHNAGAKLSLDQEELTLLGVLLLRGPQTVGELRSRSERMHDFGDLSQVEAVLQRLMEGNPPLVARLGRLPGRKEHRYAHLLGGPAPVEAPIAEEPPPTSPAASDDDRVGRLEEQLALLQSEIGTLREELKELQELFSRR